MKRIIYLLAFLSSTAFHLHAQEQQVQGIVFDKDTKQRLNKVYIYNLRTHKGAYNNSKGEFAINVMKGDTLLAASQGYRVDTATVRSFTTLVVYLKSISILLKEIRLIDTSKSPAARLEKNKADYNDIYRKGNNKDLLSLGGANGIGAGLSIDALFSMFSRQGKNARYLQQIMERDYREAMIDYRYTSSTVSRATGLSGSSLSDFMQQYRPSYYFVLEANEYEMIDFIRKSYQSYLRNPARYRLEPLMPEKVD